MVNQSDIRKGGNLHGQSITQLFCSIPGALSRREVHPGGQAAPEYDGAPPGRHRGVPQPASDTDVCVGYPNVSQKELARMYGVSGATIAVSLKKLERGGYIRRLVDQEDNRCNQICITDKGRKVVEDSVKIFRQMESRMFEGFSENDMKVLGQLLDRIYGNLDREFTDRAQREES